MTTSRKGLVALALAGAGAALAVIVIAVVLFRLLSRDESNAAVEVGSDRIEAAKEGLRAPGTEELAKLGCAPAAVIDMRRLLGEASTLRDGEPRYVVTCDIAEGAEPSCDRTASVYFGAVGGRVYGSVNVRVSRRGAIRPLCSRLYAPSGADLGSFPRTE
jgi:hypothetical protein